MGASSIRHHLKTARLAAEQGDSETTKAELRQVIRIPVGSDDERAIRDCLATALASHIEILSNGARELLQEQVQQATQEQARLQDEIGGLESQLQGLEKEQARLKIAVEVDSLLDNEATDLLESVRELDQEVKGKRQQRDQARRTLKQRFGGGRG